jgi:hypothetical protein
LRDVELADWKVRGEEAEQQKFKAQELSNVYQARSGLQISLGDFVHGFESGQIRMPAPQPALTAHDLAKGARSRVFTPRSRTTSTSRAARRLIPRRLVKQSVTPRPTR